MAQTLARSQEPSFRETGTSGRMNPAELCPQLVRCQDLTFFFFFFLRQYVLMWPNGPGICYVAMGWPQSGSSCVPPTQCWGYKCVPQMPSTLGVSYSMPVGKVPYL